MLSADHSEQSVPSPGQWLGGSPVARNNHLKKTQNVILGKKGVFTVFKKI